MWCFNPRPPKRTLCLDKARADGTKTVVSIHVLRRGRCVSCCTLALTIGRVFQSTSSEEDVVSRSHADHARYDKQFQSTSSEEDVVSAPSLDAASPINSFNPRPPKRTLCRRIVSWVQDFKRFNPRPPKRTLCLKEHGKLKTITQVSIHVLRRGRCVNTRSTFVTPFKTFQSTSSEEDVVSRLYASVNL